MKGTRPLDNNESVEFPPALTASSPRAIVGYSCSAFPLADASANCSAYRLEMFGRMTGQFTEKRGRRNTDFRVSIPRLQPLQSPTRPDETQTRTGDIYLVQELLGHCTVATTQKYMGVNYASAREFVEAIAIGYERVEI